MEHKLPRRALLVWRIRITLAALAVCFLTGLFFTPDSLVWQILTGIWSVLYLAFFLIWYPIRYHKLSYFASRHILILNYGVIYTRRRSVLAKNIQYVTLIQWPLPRLLGLCGLYVHVAGAKLCLPCIPLKDGLTLQQMFQSSLEEEP